MREIKFRAWDGERYLYLENADFEISYCGVQLYAEFGGSRIIECDLEQFTGLRDKNGKDIYEGDIYISTYRAGGAGSIRGRAKERIRQAVEWDDRGRWGRKRIEQGRGYGCCHPNCELGEDIEVIGNIHENPELLK